MNQFLETLKFRKWQEQYGELYATYKNDNHHITYSYSAIDQSQGIIVKLTSYELEEGDNITLRSINSLHNFVQFRDGEDIRGHLELIMQSQKKRNTEIDRSEEVFAKVQTELDRLLEAEKNNIPPEDWDKIPQPLLTDIFYVVAQYFDPQQESQESPDFYFEIHAFGYNHEKKLYHILNDIKKLTANDQNWNLNALSQTPDYRHFFAPMEIAQKEMKEYVEILNKRTE